MTAMTYRLFSLLTIPLTPMICPFLCVVSGEGEVQDEHHEPTRGDDAQRVTYRDVTDRVGVRGVVRTDRLTRQRKHRLRVLFGSHLATPLESARVHQNEPAPLP